MNFNNEPRQFPITPTRKRIMNCLNESDRALSCREIGEAIGHSALNNLNHSLIKLMSAEMVIRPGKRKGYFYSITNKGRMEFDLIDPKQPKAS